MYTGFGKIIESVVSGAFRRYGFSTDSVNAHNYWFGPNDFPQNNWDWEIPHVGATYVMPMADGHTQVVRFADARFNGQAMCDPTY